MNVSRWRRIVSRRLVSDAWLLQLECGHEAYRSSKNSVEELPERVLCHACRSLIGSRIKNAAGQVGVVASFRDGKFDIAWQQDGTTRLPLDQLRETVEIL